MAEQQKNIQNTLLLFIFLVYYYLQSSRPMEHSRRSMPWRLLVGAPTRLIFFEERVTLRLIKGMYENTSSSFSINNPYTV